MNSSVVRLITVVSLVAFVLQAGCSSVLAPRPDMTRFYLLTPLSEMEGSGTALPDEPALGSLSLGLGPIELPGYLDREHLVTRVAPNRVDVADSEMWAEPLGAGFNRVLTENLGSLLGTREIGGYPLSGARPDYEVQIDVVRFEPTADHSADLLAHWSLKNGKTREVLLSRSATVKLAARSADAAGSVGALSEALGQLSIQIAGAIRQVHSQMAYERPRGP